MKKFKLSIIFILLSLCFSYAQASDVTNSDEYDEESPPQKKSFFSSSSEGYFWYQKEPEKRKKKKVKKPVITQVAPAKEEQKIVPQKEKGLVVGSTEWIKQNLESYKKLAIDKPTVANVKAYLYIQRLALDRAEQFAVAGRMAIEGDPLLDSVTRSPTGGAMNVLKRSFISEEQKRFLKKMFTKLGIIYVFKDKCFLCNRQATVLKYTSRLLNAEVRAISLDEPTEGNLSAQEYPNYTINPDLAKHLKIYALPATFVYNSETDEIKPLLQGMVTQSDLFSRLINLTRKYKWASPNDIKYAQPFEDESSFSGLFDINSEFAKKVEAQGGVDPYGKDTNFVDPVKIVEMIQKEKDRTLPKEFSPRGY